MTIRTSQARQLCNQAELDLYLASLARAVRQHTLARLKSKIARARKLRDKYRDLAAVQRREARGKQTPRGSRASQGNLRTARKAELFDEVLGRFEGRLAELEAAAKEAAASDGADSKRASPAKKRAVDKQAARKRPVARKNTAVKTKATVKKGAKTVAKKALKKPAAAQGHLQATETDAEHAAKQSRLHRSGRKRIHVHLAAQGRRRQACRDAR